MYDELGFIRKVPAVKTQLLVLTMNALKNTPKTLITKKVQQLAAMLLEVSMVAYRLLLAHS